MLLRRVMMIVPALALCLTGPVRGQAEIEALVTDEWSQSALAWRAASDLGYTVSRVQGEGFFIDYLSRQSWDLVIMELPHDDLTQKETIAQLLEDHVAAGGRLLVNFNNLDEWPRLQKLMGVESVVSLGWPKQRVEEAALPHPSWRFLHMSQLYSPWPDAGDELTPATGSEIAAQFDDQTTASIVGETHRTIVNGFGWDSYSSGTGGVIVKNQIQYIMECRADFDQSTGTGVLDIFDFLEFQNAFVQQDPRANLNFDENFDIFDFLAFQNAFVNGCA